MFESKVVNALLHITTFLSCIYDNLECSKQLEGSNMLCAGKVIKKISRLQSKWKNFYQAQSRF